MTPILRFSYVVENDSMTDEEFDNQDNRELIVTSEMLERLITENDSSLKEGDTIEWQYVTMQRL